MNILYLIYYEFGIAYVGRTKQKLQARLHGHFFKKPMHRDIEINAVTKIEYAELPTVADMYLYEVYLINNLKPPLNFDDKATDELTVELPPLEFRIFESHLMEKWENQIKERDKLEEEKRKLKIKQDIISYEGRFI